MILMLFDLVVAFRGLRRNPVFTLVAVATLALGIGANTTMFSVVNSVLLRPLPGYETDRLIRLRDSGRGGALGFLNPEAFKQIRAENQSFDQLAAMQFCGFNMTGLGEPEQLFGPCVTANWFELQRARPMLGRTFLPDEDQPGRNRVVVLDHGYWMRRFGGDRKILGKTVNFDNAPWVVIGVMPPEFKPLGATQSPIFTPYVVDENPHGLHVAGRLKPGVSLLSAQAEMEVITKRLQNLKPDFRDIKLTLTPVLEELTGPQRPLLLLLLGAVSFVFLIACVNVANLLLARSAARQHEIDVRIALGATTRRIIRFALAEALLISIAASIGAVVIAHGGLRALKVLTSTLPRADEISVDWSVFAYALTIGVAAALLFGIAPALRSARANRAAGMQGRATTRWQGTLVASEVALAFVLLIGAGLLIRTFVTIRGADLGYDPRNVLTHFLSLPPSADGNRAQGLALYDSIREELRKLPGVIGVATASSLPMGGVTMTMDVQPDGEPPLRRAQTAALDVVSADYFRVIGIPLRAGRVFSATDRTGGAPVVVVSESIASRYFAGKAIGRRLVLPELEFNFTGNREIRAEVVGVVGNICVNSVTECDAEHIYLPESQAALRMTYLMVRTSGDPLASARAVRRAAFQASATIPLDDATTLEQRTAYLTDTARQFMWLLGVFAGLALMLAAIGIYGVSHFLVGQRLPEIGVRMALGATVADISRLIYQGSLIAAAIGLAAGGIASAWLTRLLTKYLVGVSAFDPVTISVAALALLGIVVAATTGPALRGAFTDPAAVLRRE